MEVGLSIAQMQRGMDVEGFYLLKAAFAKVTASGKPFLSAVLADTSGTIEAKVWDYSGPIGERDVGKVLKVRGSVSDYRGMPQLTVDKLRLAEDNDRVDVSKLVSVAPIDREAGYDEVKALVSTIEDADYRAVCEEMLRRHEAAFRTIPAAKSVHHSFLSGLLMHTLNMLRLADFLSAQYADTVNRSLLLTGTLLHDFAKEQEFTFSELGLVTDYSTKGQLLGHLVMGAQEVAAIAAELDLPEEKATLLEHLILSHHGQPEFGAAVLPQCAEAELLSLVDQIDSRMEIYREVLAPLKAGEFSQRVFALDNRRVYKHQYGWQRQRRCTGQRGRFSFKRESPPLPRAVPCQWDISRAVQGISTSALLLRVQIQHRLDHSPADGEGLVRDRRAVLRLTARVHVARLHALFDGDAVVQHAAQHTADGTLHRLTLDKADGLALLDRVADAVDGSKNAVARRAQHALARKAADEAGNVRVRQCAAGVDDAPERVAAHRLDDRVAVLPRREAGADAHDDRRVVDLRAEIALGKNRVHERVRRELLATGALRVGQNRQRTLAQQLLRLRGILRAHGAQALDRCLSVDDGIGKRHRAADGRRAGEVGHHHVDPAAPQSHGRAARDVSCAANQCKHTYTP